MENKEGGGINNNKNDEKKNLTDANGVKSITDLWQRYSSPMAWSEMYNEYVNYVTRMTEIYYEYAKSSQRMTELYKELAANAEKMTELYKESATSTERISKYWLDFFWKPLSENKEGNEERQEGRKKAKVSKKDSETS